MKILHLPLFFLISFSVLAQNLTEKTWTTDIKDKLTADLNNYLDATYLKDWNRVADMIYPGLYQISSKEEIIRAMQNGTKSMEYEIDIHPSSDMYIYPRYVEKDGKKYALIAYTNNFSMRFFKKPHENDLTFKGRMDYTYHNLQKYYTPDQITRGSEPGIFHFKIPKHILAIYLPETDSFTFIDFSNNLQKLELFKKILDKDIIKYFSEKIKSRPNRQ